MSNLFVTFRANDNSGELYLTPSPDGSDWQSPATNYPDLTANNAPCLAPFNGKYYLAYRADDGSKLLTIATSFDGQTFSDGTQIAGIKLGGTPAIAAFNHRLFVAFKANDSSDALYVSSTPDGVNWISPAQGYGGIKLGSAPALAAFKDKLYLAYRSDDSADELILRSSSDGASWSSPITIADSKMNNRPSLAAFNGKLYIAFRADDGTDQLKVTASEDGETWPTPTAYPSIEMGHAPSMAAYDNTLFLAFRSNASNNRLNLTSTQDGTTWSSPTEYSGIQMGSSPNMSGGAGNFRLSGSMLIHDETANHPDLPDGCVAIALESPDSATASDYYPLLSCNGKTYWAYSYADNRNSLCIVAYGFNGRIWRQWEKSGTRKIWKITADMDAQTVTFIGESSTSVTMTFAELDLYNYQLSSDDLLAVADYYQLPLAENEAEDLAAALPAFDCATCCNADPRTLQEGNLIDFSQPNAAAAQELTVQSTSASSGSGWTIGAVVGSIAGGGIGFLIGGPAGAAAGAAVGAAAGANIGAGAALDLDTGSDPIPVNQEKSLSYFYLDDFAHGPYRNGHAWEDVPRPVFKRYGEEETIAAMGAAGSNNLVQGWYPTSAANALEAPLTNVYRPINNGTNDIYKYIFAIVKVPDESAVSGQFPYQLRFTPEDWYPDTMPDRINHSQLTNGYPFLALLGYDTMLCYAAGSLYMIDHQLVGMDTRSGHYYKSFLGQDANVIANTLSMLATMGFNTSDVRTGEELNALITPGLYV